MDTCVTKQETVQSKKRQRASGQLHGMATDRWFGAGNAFLPPPNPPPQENVTRVLCSNRVRHITYKLSRGTLRRSQDSTHGFPSATVYFSLDPAPDIFTLYQVKHFLLARYVLVCDRGRDGSGELVCQSTTTALSVTHSGEILCIHTYHINIEKASDRLSKPAGPLARDT